MSSAQFRKPTLGLKSRRSLALGLAVGALPVMLGACGPQTAVGVEHVENPRMKWSHEPLLGIGTTLNGTAITLSLLGQVTPPTVAGTATQASDIFYDGSNVFVTYNVVGTTQKGAVDKISPLVPLFPSLTAESTFSDLDVFSIIKSGTSIYAMGASGNVGNAPALIKELTQPTSSTFSAATNFAELPSYAAVAATVRGTSMYAISGDTGGMTVINTSTKVQSGYLAIADARGVAYSSLGTGNMFVIAGQPGRIVEATTAGVSVRTISLGGASIAESKSTIVGGKTMLLATVGDGGTKIVCQADGVVLASIANPVVSGLSAAVSVANAASAAPGLIFVANGEAGVNVYSAVQGTPSGSTCNSVTTTLVGTIAMSAGVSANNLRYAGGNLYVATGSAGFKIILVPNLTLVNPLADFN